MNNRQQGNLSEKNILIKNTCRDRESGISNERKGWASMFSVAE